MKKIIIVRTKRKKNYSNIIAKQITNLGYDGMVVGIDELNDYLSKNGYSPEDILIHARTAHPGRIYGIFKDLEDKGYKILNSPEVLKITSDKFRSCEWAKENQIPCAESYKVDKLGSLNFIKEKIDEWGKVIVKPRTSQGQGEYCFVFNANIDKESIEGIPAKELVVQKYIKHNRLNRVLVIGKKSIDKAVFWDAPKENWKCSVCMNPKINCYENPPAELLEFAENIAKKLDSDVSFIDIFSTEKGYVLNEINTACNLEIHERISKYNISKEIVNHLLNKI